MINYTEQNAFTATQIYDLNDLVKGGLAGASNIPLKALLDRTVYLKDRLYRYDSPQLIDASATIDNSIIGKFVNAKAIGANTVITLDALTNFPYGFVLPVFATCAALKNITIQAAPNQIIYLNGSYMDNKIFMHDGECLFLMRDTGTWTVISYKGNFERVGECVSGYVQMPGTLIRNGSIGTINVADYPRLCWWIDNKLTAGQQKVTDSQWLSDPGGVPVYRGCFSTGNTTTTRRLPDDRGLFDRYLDMNRGLDNTRIHKFAGGFEEMMLQKHNHSIKWDLNGSDGTPNTRTIPGGNSENNGSGTDTTSIGSFGGDSTHPKNNAKLPLIIY